jgi:hypothetical protein
MLNGRRQLFDHVKSFMAGLGKDLKDKQVNEKLHYLLTKHRDGVFMPERTSKSFKMKTAGAPNSKSKAEQKKNSKKHNPKNNPINNPKNNKKNSQKRKAANGANNRAIIKSQGLDHHMRSEAEAETKLLCERLLSIKKYAILGNKTMSQAIEEKSHAIYIGTTGRALREEDLRWLTARGAQDQGVTRSGLVLYKGRTNRPVLLNENGTCITMGEARSKFGAKSVEISHSRLRLNETDLEDALQTKLQLKLLGLQRLHRHAAMGAKLAAKAAEEMEDPDFLVKTSMTCLPVTRHCTKRKPEWVEFNNKRAKVSY